MRRIIDNERFGYLAQNLVWVWLGLAALLSAVAYILDPTGAVASTPLHQLLLPYDAAWNLLWGAGGVGMMIGVLGRKPDIEAAGLMLFSGGLLMYTIAIAVVSTTGALGLFAYPALILAAVMRVAWLVAKALELRDGKRRGDLDRRTTLLSVGIVPIALLIAETSLPGGAAGVAAILGIVFGGGGFAAYRLIRPQRDELTAKTADAITSAADRIVRQQSAALERAAVELSAAHDEIAKLRDRLEQLEAKVLHQQQTDYLLTVEKQRADVAEALVERMNGRLDQLVSILRAADVQVPREHILDSLGDHETPPPKG